MRAFMRLAVAGALSAGMTVAAHAADMPGLPFPDFKKEGFTHLVSGWYVRGDLGYQMRTIGSVEPSPTTPAVTNWHFHNGPTVGFGGGYKHEWFRADFTIDYAFRGQFKGDTATQPNYYTAKIDSFTMLANVYLDLGTWGGFTPYVGGGVGATILRTHEYWDVTMPAVGLDNSRTNFSWAAMGGVAIRISPKMVLDAGYRYLKLGDALGDAVPATTTAQTAFRNLTAHEARIGLRWILD